MDVNESLAQVCGNRLTAEEVRRAIRLARILRKPTEREDLFSERVRFDEWVRVVLESRVQFESDPVTNARGAAPERRRTAEAFTTMGSSGSERGDRSSSALPN